MIDVCDGKYVGYLTVEQVIDQYEYRAGIHLSFIEYNEIDSAYEVYGTTEYHWWAINGYEQGIIHLRRKNVLARMMRWGFRLVYK